MTWSHFNLSQRSSDADETVEYLNNEYWEFCSTYHARKKRLQRDLYRSVILNTIHRKFKKVCKTRNYIL